MTGPTCDPPGLPAHVVTPVRVLPDLLADDGCTWTLLPILRNLGATAATVTGLP
jgi:hypothetical protein